jgi:predicted PurR-regulated permease PerM
MDSSDQQSASSAHSASSGHPASHPAVPEAPAPTTPPLSATDRDATEAVTWPVRVAAAWSWRLVVILAGAYVALRMLEKVSLVAFAIVLSLLIASVLHPVERWLRRILPGPRSLPAALTVLIGIVVIGGVGYFVAWQISSNAGQLGDQINAFVDKTRNWLQHGPLHLKQSDFDNLTKNITDTLQKHQGALISGAISTIQTLGEVGASLLLILLTTFFFLRDGEAIWRWVVSLFPREAHPRMDKAGHLGWHTLGGYMRGVVLIAAFHAVAITIVLLILRVPLAPALGVVIFLGSFIPLIGLIVAGSLCVAVTLIEHGVTSAIVVAILIIVLVQVESHVLQPTIMSRTVEVHPLAVAVSVLAGTAVAGIPGALIAVPLVAFCNTTIRALRAPNEAVDTEGFPVEVHEGPTDAHAEADESGAKRTEPSSPPTGADRDGESSQ